MQRFLVILGSLVLLAGLAWPWLSRIGFGRLPGDFSIERDTWSFHFPLMTCLIVSLLFTLVLWLFRK